MPRKKLLLLIPILAISGCNQAVFLEPPPEDIQSIEDGLAYSDTYVDEAEINLADAVETIDYGNPDSQPGELQLASALPGDGRSHIEGAWSTAYPWPLSPIHAALLPNGSVMSYGASEDRAKRGRAFEIDRWDPSRGFSQSSHDFAPTGIDTNVFCSAQTVMPNGNVLISGGDKQSIGANNALIRNEGIRSTSLYTSATNTLSVLPNMRFPRWYPTLVTLSNGSQLTLGGRAEKKDANSQQVVPIMPELYNPTDNTWRVLRGARNANFYKGTWFYPRAFMNDRGTVTVFSNTSSDIYEINVNGGGSFNKVGRMSDTRFKLGAPFPATMYSDGKVLVMGRNGKTHTIDINSRTPTSVETSQPDGIRYWGNTTVLADGKVLLVGGSRQRQKLNTAIHYGEIWDPELDSWQKTRESTSKKARLYHSVSLLLPDASVLVAGGGPPGPVINMNADVFYPPYLFKKNGSGERAVRPVIQDMGLLSYGAESNVVMSNNRPVSRVTLVRSGSVTHAFDSSQRLIELNFTQSESVLTVQVPASRNRVPPGLYMMFAFDDDGVPSEAQLQIIK